MPPVDEPRAPSGEDLLITEALVERVAAKRDIGAQNEAVYALSRLLVEDPDALPARLVQIAFEYCRAGSAGISLLERSRAGEAVFRWTALAGRLAPYLGGATLRGFSPCGLCLDRGGPILLSDPARLFTYLRIASIPIIECLIVPAYGIGRQPLGAIWVMAHDEACKFDGEDLRLMIRLADFVVACRRLRSGRKPWWTRAGDRPGKPSG